MAQTKPSRVLFVTHKHPPSLGGMQRQSFELVRNYREIGDASLIAFNSRYPVWIFFLIVIPWIAFKLIAERDIDFIHGNDGLMGVFLTPFLLTGKKLFVTIHGVDIVLRSRAYQWWVRTFLRWFVGIIAVSAQTADECIARGIPSDKVTCIPNACDVGWSDEIDPGFAAWLEREYGLDPSGKIVVCSVGRSVPRKGFYWFASEVLPHLPDETVYVLVGPKEKNKVVYRLLGAILPHEAYKSLCHAVGIGIDYFKLKEMSGRPNLKGRLFMLGSLSRHQLNQLYLHSQIFVMPNLKVNGDYEGFGLVAQEAAYNGALCIAADVDGIPSAVRHDETGILLPSDDPTAWIGIISDLCADRRRLEEKATLFRKNARATDHSWMSVAIAYRNRFEASFAAG